MNNNCYIKSIEGADIYSHMLRNKKLKNKYIGMIPYSLELIKLESKGIGFKVKKNNKIGKTTSDDIINVKFNQKVKSGKDVIKSIEKKINKLDKEMKDLSESDKVKIEELKSDILKLNVDSDKGKVDDLVKQVNRLDKTNYKEILTSYIDLIQSELSDPIKWDEKKIESLRTYLFNDGFTITTDAVIDKKTGEVIKNAIDTKFKLYKRSSAKSRTGQCLMIKETILDEMISWSRMGLNFNDWKGDYSAELAYESLVGSAIENTIVIDPHRILIVDDVTSYFNCDVNLIMKVDGKLDSIPKKDYQISNSLFDGESMLETSYFADGHSFYLLRHHFCKSAAFNTNLQQFLKDHCPKNIQYNEWILYNKFNEPIKACDVIMVMCPTSLKALKFKGLQGKYGEVINTEKDMWHYWQKIVDEDNDIWGICKHEKISKRGWDEDGNILNQSSYQMLNSLPISSTEMKELCSYELKYVEQLKNNDDTFIQYLIDTNSDMNCNMMMASLARHNPDIILSEKFRDFRSSLINKYVTHCKKGKIKLNGDYCILLGNGIEYLYHAINSSEFDSKNPNCITLKDNQIYTKLFNDGDELSCFRNPHTSPSNCLLAKNTVNSLIDTYFNLNENIVVCNAISFPLQDLLSSCDYDSDSMVIFKDHTLLENVKKVYGKYHVCINGVDKDDNTYEINNSNMAIIDNQLANSQRFIGETVNAGQLIMSAYWNEFHKGDAADPELMKDLMKKVDIATVLSCIAIDSAKKTYSIDIETEIKNLLETEALTGQKPNFFKFVSKNKAKKTTKSKFIHFDTSMDYLQDILNDIDPAVNYKDANGKLIKYTKLVDSLITHDLTKTDYNQEHRILNYVKNMCNRINACNANFEKTSDEDSIEDAKKERDTELDNIIQYYHYYLNKATITEDTMYGIIFHMLKKSNTKTQLRLLNELYNNNSETFLKVFNNKN